jgi:hypothetical protein
LQQTGIRAVDDAIALLALGKYKEGRARLEAAAKALGGEKRQIQARALHALGVARVLAPSPGSSDLSDALRALRLAEQVDTRPRYRDTIRQVKELSDQVKVLAAQQQAYEHNFKLAGAGAGASSSAPESAPSGAPAAPPAPPAPVPPPAGK